MNSAGAARPFVAVVLPLLLRSACATVASSNGREDARGSFAAIGSNRGTADREAKDAPLENAMSLIQRLRTDNTALYQLVTDPHAVHGAHDATICDTLGASDTKSSRSSVTGTRDRAEPSTTAASAALGNTHVAVCPSGIAGAGRGAFARRRFAAGEQVGRYICKVVRNTEHHDPLRSWNLNGSHVCDASAFLPRVHEFTMKGRAFFLNTTSHVNLSVVPTTGYPSPSRMSCRQAPWRSGQQ